MNHTSDFIYSSTTSGAALRDEHVSHSATGQPSEYNIGDRELLVESRQTAEPKRAKVSFVSLVSYFPTLSHTATSNSRS